MLGGCAFSIHPRSSASIAWATNTISVIPELTQEILIGDGTYIAFNFKEGQRCGGVLTQAYSLVSWTFEGTPGTVGNVAPAKTLADFPADFFVEVEELPHSLTSTQYMSIKFQPNAKLDLSFSVRIQASWKVGSYHPQIAGSTNNPPLAFTPTLTYATTSVLSSANLKLTLTE